MARTENKFQRLITSIQTAKRFLSVVPISRSVVVRSKYTLNKGI
jgi:hypothetical protein